MHTTLYYLIKYTKSTNIQYVFVDLIKIEGMHTSQNDTLFWNHYSRIDSSYFKMSKMNGMTKRIMDSFHAMTLCIQFHICAMIF